MATPENPLFGFSVKEIARVCRVDITTARRWKRGAICPPIGAVALLEGDLGFLDPAWRGWVLRHGHLISPENWSMSMSDVLASRLHEAQLAAWRAEVSKMRAELANALVNRLEEQPRPEDWELEILVS
jgi:hypothetical protein